MTPGVPSPTRIGGFVTAMKEAHTEGTVNLAARWLAGAGQGG